MYELTPLIFFISAVLLLFVVFVSFMLGYLFGMSKSNISWRQRLKDNPLKVIRDLRIFLGGCEDIRRFPNPSKDGIPAGFGTVTVTDTMLKNLEEAELELQRAIRIKENSRPSSIGECFCAVQNSIGR